MTKFNEDLEKSCIGLELAKQCGIYYEDSASKVNGQYKDCPAMILPYYDLDGKPMLYQVNGKSIPFQRVRYYFNNTRWSLKRQRYAQPKASGVKAYFPRVYDWREIANDPSVELVITEGEKKAVSMASIDVPCIGLGGVYNFLRRGSLIPELEEFNWEGRQVNIAFDSDLRNNAMVRKAQNQLVSELLQRDAEVWVVHIPDDGKNKYGLDDYLLEFGEDALLKLFEEHRHNYTGLKKAVLDMNRDVFWVESEGQVYDMKTDTYIDKGDLQVGSQYSTKTIEIVTPDGKLRKVKLATAWLSHEDALRHHEVTCDPTTTEKVLIRDDGSTAYNSFKGFDAAKGDVTPFIELTEHLFQELDEELRSLPIKLCAYKAQHPEEKIPLAMLLQSSTQGTGKSMWASIVRSAFGAHGRAVPPQSFVSDFNGWLEGALLAVVDELEPAQASKGGEVIKALISEKRRLLNEKYRIAREIDNLAFFIMTTNHTLAAAYDKDDRRMFIAQCSFKNTNEFYRRIGEWSQKPEAAKAVMYYLLNYPLGDWTPPSRAPMTQEKYMAYYESLTPAGRLAEDIQTADENIILTWVQGAAQWAEANALDDRKAGKASEVAAAMSNFPIRPWYSPEELTMLFPMVSEQLHGKRQVIDSAAVLSQQLRAGGVRFLRCKDNPRGFMWHGRLTPFLVVSDTDEWTQPLTQEEFERRMRNFPRYRDLVS